jgi:type II secretory pathway component HofQ
MKFFLALVFSFSLFLIPAHLHAQVAPSESTGTVEQQPLISNVFYETDVKEALAAIAGQSGINIVTDQTVYGFISLELVNVPFEEALRRVLAPFGLTF